MRHLGILIRYRNMCPLRVHSWTDIKEDQLEHMWDVVTLSICGVLLALYLTSHTKKVRSMRYNYAKHVELLR